MLRPARIRPVTGAHRKFDSETHRHGASSSTAIAFVASVMVTLCLGLLSLSEKAVSIPSWVNQDGAHCVRVQRLGDAALASVSIGTPPRVVKLVVRLDRVVHTHEAHSSTVVFADELLRSDTLRCDDSRHCSDVVVLSESSTGKQIRSYAEFKYGTAASAEWWVEKQIGAEGSMALVRGFSYSLTKTHFCWASNETVVVPNYDNSNTVYSITAHRDNETGAVYTTGELIKAGGRREGDPFFDAPATACNASIEVFPVAAAAEQNWLALSSGFLYEASSQKLDSRRRLVERGLDCSQEQSDYDIYEMDCTLDPYATCKHLPSIPFRRLSRYTIDINPSSVDNTVSFAATSEVALSRISGALSLSETVFFAAVRLCVLLIVAFVVYSRAERQTASAYHTINAALNIASGKETRGYHTRLSTITDAAVGVLAFVSRIAVVAFQSPLLISDGHVDAVIFELIGIVASVLHFLLRNIVLETDLSKESPIQKLGGSMALADAANAALLSVVSTPTLQVSTREFDSVARLFCGVLIAIFVLHRCWFSITSCTLLASTTATDKRFDPIYPILLWTAALLWMTQTISIVFGFGRFFVVPQAYSIHRNWLGETTATKGAVFFTLIAVGVPLVNTVVVKLARNRL